MRPPDLDTGVGPGRGGAGASRGSGQVLGWAGPPGMGLVRTGHDEPAAAGGRPKDAVVADLVDPRGRDEGGQLLQELQGFEDHMGGPVAPATLEAVEQPAIGEARQPLRRHWRPAHVPAEPLEPPAVAARHPHLRMDGQAAEGDATRARPFLQILWAPLPPSASPPPDATSDRSRESSGSHLEGRNRPVRHLMVVDCPAPLGPRKP